jgi:hypothetical protein
MKTNIWWRIISVIPEVSYFKLINWTYDKILTLLNKKFTVNIKYMYIHIYKKTELYAT